MNGHTLIDVIDNINDKYIDEAVNYQCQKVVRFNRWQMFGVAAACFCFVVGVGTHQYNYYYSVDSIVDIDINPSIELKISKAERVLSAEALNEDAQVVLEGMKLEDVDLDSAVDALIGSLIEHEYLDEVHNAINVCVKNDDEEAGTELGQKLTGEIVLVLEENSLVGKVQSQTHAKDSELTEIAAAYGVSEGKLVLAKQASESTGMLLEETVELSIEELWELSEGVEGINKSEDVEEETEESIEADEEGQITTQDTIIEGETEEVSSEAPSEEPSETPEETQSELPSKRAEEESETFPSEEPKGEWGKLPNDRPGGEKGEFRGGSPERESGERTGKNNDKDRDNHKHHHK